MFSLQIKLNYKYKYLIIRNRRQIAEAPTKQSARAILRQIHESYQTINYQQDTFNYASNFILGGDCLILYTNFKTGASSEEYRDIFEFKRVLNT